MHIHSGLSSTLSAALDCLDLALGVLTALAWAQTVPNE